MTPEDWHALGRLIPHFIIAVGFIAIGIGGILEDRRQRKLDDWMRPHDERARREIYRRYTEGGEHGE